MARTGCTESVDCRFRPSTLRQAQGARGLQVGHGTDGVGWRGCYGLIRPRRVSNLPALTLSPFDRLSANGLTGFTVHGGRFANRPYRLPDDETWIPAPTGFGAFAAPFPASMTVIRRLAFNVSIRLFLLQTPD